VFQTTTPSPRSRPQPLPTAHGPHPRSGPPEGSAVPHPEGVSNEDFRAALSRLAAGVVLVTAFDADSGPRGEDAGMTATSFVSVSLEPPLVLISLRNGSRMDDLLTEQPLWGVSVLAEGQQQIAARFAMKGRISDRLLFEDLSCTRGRISGSLLVGGALATLECRTEQRVPAGDHTLVIGRVLGVGLPAAETTEPLAYFRGRYRRLG
jgi:flavin reductase (DIM6/NTAB) family NADH-FMN oxidoreductase RutF